MSQKILKLRLKMADLKLLFTKILLLCFSHQLKTHYDRWIMKINNMTELLNSHIQSLHNIETQIVAALPQMINEADSQELKDTLSKHLEVTKDQLSRIEEICRQRNILIDGKIDEGIKNILLEGQNLISQIDNPALKDSAIMGGTEKVEHYEIAAYQSAKTLADKLDMDDVSDKLGETLKEEKLAANKMSMLASGGLVGKIGQILD